MDTPPASPVSVTGIKPTGEPHLGNLVGAIRPALAMTRRYDSFLFIADHHALTTERDPARLRHFTRSVAATWLAAGLDPEHVTMYRQSDVPETFELAWVLSCVAAKGLMNRAHAYKAARDRNVEAGDDPDAGVNMGLYNYPVLMAADIIAMGADVVPVGRDQSQHVEYAADLAGSFNAAFPAGHRLVAPRLVVPDAATGATLPGLDGRKMSKSYDNHIPALAPAGQLKKMVRRIATDSTPVEDPKDADASVPFQILTQFAEPDVVADVRKRLEAGGTGWGELKNLLVEVLEVQLAPMRERYEELVAPGSELDDLLAAGAARARTRARATVDGVRAAVGIA